MPDQPKQQTTNVADWRAVLEADTTIRDLTREVERLREALEAVWGECGLGDSPFASRKALCDYLIGVCRAALSPPPDTEQDRCPDCNGSGNDQWYDHASDKVVVEGPCPNCEGDRTDD